MDRLTVNYSIVISKTIQVISFLVLTAFVIQSYFSVSVALSQHPLAPGLLHQVRGGCFAGQLGAAGAGGSRAAMGQPFFDTAERLSLLRIG